MYTSLSKRITLQRYYKNESKKAFIMNWSSIHLLQAESAWTIQWWSSTEIGTSFNLEKNSAASYLSRLCSEVFLMFLWARIIKNTMPFICRPPSANTAVTASFLSSLWVFLLFVGPAEACLYKPKGGKRGGADSEDSDKTWSSF